MKQNSRKAVVIAVLIFIGLAGVWFGRGWLRDAVTTWNQPELPAAQPFATSTPIVPVPTPPVKTPPVKPPVATSTSPQPSNGAFPKSINLAVPFLSQAPKMNWDALHEDACEEASVLMVKGYYDGAKNISVEQGDQAILDFVAYEEAHGFLPSTTAEETATMIRDHLGLKNVLVLALNGPDDIKRQLAKGYPVIVPADGKELENPNFKNGGPVYHMLVVKGYLEDGRWITNDPGTRKGADFIYSQANLIASAHDWNGGDVPHGRKVIIVIIPNNK